MELGAGEPQICRLCGQCESIYIDVFGEEGTKRFLGLKIYSKINILMKENDGLPRNVCIRCVGTLEFFCDFYDCCHTTQKQFLEVTKNESQGTCQRESDAESDKENAFPPSNDGKRKVKALSVGKQSETQSANSSVSKKKSVIDATVEKDERTIAHGKRSEFMHSAIKIISPLKDDAYKSIHSQQPLRRKRGRKSQAKKMEESSLFSSLKRKLQNNINNEKVTDNQYKRHCLRAISMNSKSNEIHNSVIPSKSKIEEAAKGQIVVGALSNEFLDKNNENDPLSNDSTLETNNKDLVAVKDSVKKQSKAISVIVKQEKGETTGTFSQQSRKTNELVWIPSDMLMQGEENFVTVKTPKVQQDMESLHLLEEETKEISNSKSDYTVQADDTKHFDGTTTAVPEDLKSKIFTEQNRETVIRSFQTNENIIPKEIQVNKTELDVKVDTTNENIQDDLESDEGDMSLSQRLIRNRKKRDKSFGKISQLISNEQKEAIETYYVVDMSVVNSAEVQQNLTIIDTKNIRCNICGTFYLRMDKCQVHIWGHLQMKPYKCTECDFATVTVTNVRCHIRKSHLKIKPFACNLCERKYATAVSLEEHINSHTGDRPYKCKLCNFASSSRQMLNYHNSSHKPLKDITCKVCNKEFYSRGRLRAHMIIHNKDKVVMCQLCSAYLSSQESLNTHHKNVHMQDYVCNVCGKCTKSRKALHNHQNVHSAAKYKCSLCPNVYKSSQILKEHLLKHEGIRKYKCNVCGKSFAQQSHLAAHMAVHSKIRFHCPGCNKAFNRHDNMKIHTKRCKLFLQNPDLKNVITKRKRTTSFRKTTELNEDSTSGGTTYSDTNVENETVDSLGQSEVKNEKCKMNLCKLGLNISYINPVDKTWSHDSMYNEAGGSTGSVNINLIQIANINETIIPDSENLIRENILGPESF
ncbi:zinc finger protein 286A-like isoform X1 [Hylaeus volcanicus]|uniref:zinc finger protein 286A-like isoform X1 n=1 Tax=Hylaeus volcanicus TaxID=313075 RepID=UPI0023B7E35A|nr:zinc finger protein 286A-like isoform X1 [Hylaeus volcanicus]